MHDDTTVGLHASRLCRFARALIGDRIGADDLVQDNMERGWKKLP
tara:strand:- start:71962 stop:72096 length:135 start_codon:yes stop_codon:yes gene_type:complete